MDSTFISGGLKIACHLARPGGATRSPGLVLCHGFPAGPGGAQTSADTYPELADRLAREAGWVVLTFNFRGCGTSQGDFSLGGWIDDLRAAVGELESNTDANGVWVAGSSLGGLVAILEAADDQRVRGVATLAAPASLSTWAADDGGLIAEMREIGVIKSPDFPKDTQAWATEIADADACRAVGRLSPRSLLILHGSADETVPVAAAKALSDAAGTNCELAIIYAAGHRLRHDPRTIALLQGWLDRQVR